MLNAVGLIIYALLKLSQTTTRINLNSYSSIMYIDISMRLMRLIKLTYFMSDINVECSFCL